MEAVVRAACPVCPDRPAGDASAPGAPRLCRAKGTTKHHVCCSRGRVSLALSVARGLGIRSEQCDCWIGLWRHGRSLRLRRGRSSVRAEASGPRRARLGPVRGFVIRRLGRRNAATGALLTDSGRWWQKGGALHINVKEVLAVRNAVTVFHSAIGDDPVLLFTDNMAARATIRRGIGRSFALNVALRRLQDTRLTWTDVKHIASAANPADDPAEPSRGEPVRATKWLEHIQQLTSGGHMARASPMISHKARCTVGVFCTVC